MPASDEAGAVEAPVTPLTLAGFNQMGSFVRCDWGLSFDRRRKDLVLREGSCVGAGISGGKTSVSTSLWPVARLDS